MCNTHINKIPYNNHYFNLYFVTNYVIYYADGTLGEEVGQVAQQLICTGGIGD